MSRRSEDTAGAAGRSVGLRPATPALPGAARGLLSRDPPLPSSRSPCACASRGAGATGGSGEGFWGSGDPAAPGKRRLGAGGSTCGSVGMG